MTYFKIFGIKFKKLKIWAFNILKYAVTISSVSKGKTAIRQQFKIYYFVVKKDILK